MEVERLSQVLTTCEDDENDAIYQIEKLLQLSGDIAGIVFFFSSKYDTTKLATAVNGHFSCPIIGCTTAGEIGPDYIDGITAIAFSVAAFKFHSVLLNLDNDANTNVTEIKPLTKVLSQTSTFSDKNSSTPKNVEESSLGFLLIDGLSVKEEKTAAFLHNAFPHLPIIGGSAGDGLHFKETFVFFEGEFHTNAAVFSFIETALDFEIFKLQHFEPSGIEFIVTDADPENRIVKELDGELATKCFADALGLKEDELTTDVFAENPLMLEIGDDWYVRACLQANTDGSLYFHCAIDIGLPLTIGKSIGIEENLKISIDKLTSKFESIELTLGCDCILRRIEIKNKDKTDAISNILRKINFAGFSTYGEQFNSLHVNQTLTGVIFGKRKNDH